MIKLLFEYIKKTLKYVGFSVFIYTLFCLITPFNDFLLNRSIDNQISYLNDILDAGYDDELQARFPEGKVFSNAILALSVIDYCNRHAAESNEYSAIVDNCIGRLLSEKSTSTFSPNMNPKYGMFYNGWTSFVLSSYRKSELFRYSSIQKEINLKSSEIKKRIISTQKDSMRILDSYHGYSWPADNLIGLISLENDTLRKKWLTTIFDAAEHESGLIHHFGDDAFQIRGSSQSMITYCLSEIDFLDIDGYNEKYKETFIDEYIGIQLVMENENGSNEMDADSGPVVFGYGASATIMNIKTQANLNRNQPKITWAVMNLISFPINLFGKKYLLLKKEPMLDLFMLWASTEL